MKIAVKSENGHPVHCLELSDAASVPEGYEVISVEELERRCAEKPEAAPLLPPVPEVIEEVSLPVPVEAVQTKLSFWQWLSSGASRLFGSK